jgi:hypothetical protein
MGEVVAVDYTQLVLEQVTAAAAVVALVETWVALLRTEQQIQVVVEGVQVTPVLADLVVPE